MNPYIITDKDIVNIIRMSTMDKGDIDMFLEVHAHSLSEHIFYSMCHYLYNYTSLEVYDKDVNTYMRVYERFKEAGYNDAQGSGMGIFNFTPMSIDIPHNGSFSMLSTSFTDDVYESLECHFGLQCSNNHSTLTNKSMPEKVQIVLDATAFVIEQIERLVFGKYTGGETVFALFGTCDGNLTIQVYTP